jgi:hypothetical protein
LPEQELDAIFMIPVFSIELASGQFSTQSAKTVMLGQARGPTDFPLAHFLLLWLDGAIFSLFSL